MMVDESNKQQDNQTPDFVPPETHELEEHEVSLGDMAKDEEENWESVTVSMDQPATSIDNPTEDTSQASVDGEKSTYQSDDATLTSDALNIDQAATDNPQDNDSSGYVHTDHESFASSTTTQESYASTLNTDKEPLVQRIKHFLIENWFFAAGFVLFAFLAYKFLTFYHIIEPSRPKQESRTLGSFNRPDQMGAKPSSANNPQMKPVTPTQPDTSWASPSIKKDSASATNTPVTPPVAASNNPPVSTSAAPPTNAPPTSATTSSARDTGKPAFTKTVGTAKTAGQNEAVPQMQDLSEDVNSITMMQLAVPIAKNISSIQTQQQQLVGQIATINQAIGQIGTNLRALQSQLTGFKETTAVINNLNQKIEEVRTIVHKQDLLLAKKPTNSTAWPLSHVPGKSSFVVMAVIPGQAWMKDQQGNLITVQPGTDLTPFGLVAKIDPVNHAVLTTSGEVFMQANNTSKE